MVKRATAQTEKSVRRGEEDAGEDCLSGGDAAIN